MTILLMETPNKKSSFQDASAVEDEKSYQQFLNDEPPSWHELILEERAEELEDPEKFSKPLDEAMEELRAELAIEFSKCAKRREG